MNVRIAAVCLGFLLFCSALLPAAESSVEEIPSALTDYVARPEPDFAWTLNGNQKTEHGTLYSVSLTSQKWQDIVWTHDLQIFEPAKLDYPQHVLLFVGGGRNGRAPDEDDTTMGLTLAKLCGARVAILHQVPNQPLMGNRVEDDLITETWLKFLETGDVTWPLLFPMAKSAVKAMDAIEQIAEKQWQQPVTGFIITGASKRGWTSWLAPVADPRILATAPIVIDTLNFRVQMQHQLDTWGAYSEQINDYSSKGLIVTGEEKPRERQLRLMMDPYTYRQRLALPKLLVNGTNDQYWVVDAMRHYWDDLVGPKWALQVPNAGHSLKGGHDLVFRTLAAFVRSVAGQTPFPVLDWSHTNGGGAYQLTLKASTKPKAARLWSAHSPTKDLREATWTPAVMQPTDAGYVGKVPVPTAGHVAYYGELEFEIQGLPYSLCTVIRRE